MRCADVAQDMVHYEKNRKLKVYKGNLSEFVKIVPEAAAYYKLESENVAFSFPDPGMLEGVTSKTKAIIKMSDVSFRWRRPPSPPSTTRHVCRRVQCEVPCMRACARHGAARATAHNAAAHTRHGRASPCSVAGTRAWSRTC